MSVTVSNPQNVSSPNGNSLAVFKDAVSNQFYVKDINGQLESLEQILGINIYNSDDSLTSNRIVTMSTYTLSFTKDLLINSLTIGKGGGSLSQNTAIGVSSLSSNVSGNFQTSIGYQSLLANTTGNLNTSIGRQSLLANTTGSSNVSIGANALGNNTTGNNNTALGYSSLIYLTSGNNNNIAIGSTSGAFKDDPFGTLTICSESIFIGVNSQAQSDSQTNQIVIGNSAVGIGSNSVVLGNTSILTTRLRGSVLGGSFVKDSGTASQYLMADGSVTTNAVKNVYTFTGNLSNTGTLDTVNLLTITIPANTFTDYINFSNIMFSKTGVAGGCQFKIWVGTTNVFASATQISNYSIVTPNLFAQINRIFSINSNTLIGFPSTAGNSTGDGSSNSAIQSTAFNPTITNYFFISVQLDNVADAIALRGVKITN